MAASRSTRIDRWVEWLVTAAGMTGLVALGLILVFIVREALPLLFDGDVTLGKLVLPQPWREGRAPTWLWQPLSRVPKVSVVPLIVGSVKVSAVAMALAAPMGIAAALFSSEFASPRARELLKPTIELLAGVPSVVLGFFALTVIATALQTLFDWPYRLNAAVAGVAMALAIVPIIFTITEDALRTVPNTYREASQALGATRWDTAWRIVLPAASPGVLAGLLLGFGRAIGETMIVLMASGNASVVSLQLRDPTRTLSATIAAEMGEVVSASTHTSLLYFLGVLLFVLNVGLNASVGAWARNRVLRARGAHA